MAPLYTEKRVKNRPSWFFYCLGLLLPFFSGISSALMPGKSKVKSAVYLSPEFVLKTGSVENYLFYNVHFPKGHIGVKSFNGEVIDGAGLPVPLFQTYVHHWSVFRYHSHVDPKRRGENNSSDIIFIRNNGVCQQPFLGQYFGNAVASESPKTKTYIPYPYAIEVGNPAEIPSGYEERWLLNVHVLDARGVTDRVGCRECRCKLYNATKDENGKPLKPDYEGGFHCCFNQTRCEMKKGVADSPRKLFFRYTIKWVDWDWNSVLPVRLYVLDVTDSVNTSEDLNPITDKHNCKVEYEVKPCVSSTNACIDARKTTVAIPKGGYLVYGVGHQYPGGTGAALYRKDGRIICASIPTYGRGREAGNEAGYVVAMSTCYPQLGSVQIDDGETLVIESNYSSYQKHTGAAGFIKIMVADQLPKWIARTFSP